MRNLIAASANKRPLLIAQVAEQRGLISWQRQVRVRSVECLIHHYSCADATRRPHQFAMTRKGAGRCAEYP